MLRRHTWWSLPVVAAFTLLIPRAPARAVQEAALRDVLSRAAAAVAAFADTSRIIVGEERYRQVLMKRREVLSDQDLFGRFKTSQVEMVGKDDRDWVAEIVLAATPGNAAHGLPWIEFRDVIAIRGRPLRDGASRLGMLATRPFEIAGPEAMKIRHEALGFVLGRFIRGIELPRVTAVFLHADNQGRFQFKRGATRTIDGVKTREVRFLERVVPSIIRAGGDQEAPSTGSFWIDPATGDVLMSVLKNGESGTVYDELTVSYRKDPATGLCLPVSSKEIVVDGDAGQRLDATATFANWKTVPRMPN